MKMNTALKYGSSVELRDNIKKYFLESTIQKTKDANQLSLACAKAIHVISTRLYEGIRKDLSNFNRNSVNLYLINADIDLALGRLENANRFLTAVWNFYDVYFEYNKKSKVNYSQTSQHQNFQN